MFTKKQSRSIFQLLTSLLAGSLMLSACSPAIPATAPSAPTATSMPAVTLESTAITAPSATVIPSMDDSLHFSLETGNLATGFQTETIPAVPASDNSPYWDVLPEYIQVTLQGYPIINHLMKPQIFIYPVEELRQVSEGAGMTVTSLQTLLHSPQDIQNMPFLPLFNAAQVMHTQTKYLDFKNGQGLRYLTQFDQAPLPINNNEMIYTYQGLTSDGKYYVAAVLPVNHPSLPSDGMVTGNEPPEFTNDFPAYLANIVSTLNPQAANSFIPDLTQLDAMMSSMEIK